MPPAPETVAEVALALPVRGSFHYRVPARLAGLIERGSVVAVPFGRRFATGYVLGCGGEAPPGIELKDVHEALLPGEALPAEVLALAERVAEYYLASVGEVLKAAVPLARVHTRQAVSLTPAGRAVLEQAAAEIKPGDRALLEALAGGEALAPAVVVRRAAVASGRERLGRLEAEGLVAIATGAEVAAPSRHTLRVELAGRGTEGEDGARTALLARSRRLAAIVAWLEAEAKPAAYERLRDEAGASLPHLRRLEAAGLVRLSRVATARDLGRRGASSRRLSGLTLTAAQHQAAAPVCEAIGRQRFEVFLLHGVTGSGKTLVYLECIDGALAAGRSAMLLVPEIALVPMLERELRGRFGEKLAVLHSGLAAGVRTDAWRRLRSGAARVVFGARSAVFAPVRDLGLVIVDEENDGSYKQDERPHYHARDVAVLRGQLAAVPVLLGSATPALESYANARAGRYRLLELNERTAGQELPAVEVVDLREEFARRGAPAILSDRLSEELGARLERREQTVLLLNRRGYASFLLCRECGVRAECPHCSVCLTYHLAERRLLCHRCGYGMRAPRACSACQGTFLHLVGYGTEKVEQAVREAFPQARVERLDRDAARGREGATRLLERFGRSEIDVLVGTQMVAKGHDFPGVTLVGVVSVDALLGLPDFRATERAFSLLTQVAGRAGRGERKGKVILQTYYPDNEAVKLACLQDYRRFFEREGRLRRLLGNPPASHLVNLVVRGRDPARLRERGEDLARALRAGLAPGVKLLGPATAPIERIRGEHRCQLLLKAASRPALRSTLEAARAALDGLLLRGVLDFDVDPQDLL